VSVPQKTDVILQVVDLAQKSPMDNGATQVALSTVKEEQEFTQVLTPKKVKMTQSSQHATVSLNTNVLAKIEQL
jgi:hypothetical protein